MKKSLENNKLQEFQSIMTIYFNENIDHFTKNEEIDFLHQFSGFPQKSVSQEYRPNQICINGREMCNMEFEWKFDLFFGR